MILSNLINARELYEKYKLYFINPKINEITSETNALKLINNTLPLHVFSIQDFGLPDISSQLMEYNDNIEDRICTHTVINDDELVKNIQWLNDCQHKIFTEITTAVSCDNETKLFFIDGPGKTGKKLFIKYLEHVFEEQNLSTISSCLDWYCC